MRSFAYDRDAACQYATLWAMHRNPAYPDFSKLGGDCTNFISQCLFAGGGIMNPTPTFGWYYYDLQHRSPAWSAARYLCNFLKTNDARGPVARQAELSELEPGDIIFLTRGDTAYHSLFVSDISGPAALVSTHSFDAYRVPLSAYSSDGAVFMHILYFQA